MAQIDSTKESVMQNCLIYIAMFMIILQIQAW